MSYCRNDGVTSEVYMYHHTDGYIECAACRLTKLKRYRYSAFAIEFSAEQGISIPNTYVWYQDKKFKTRSNAFKHLMEHVKAGHKVPTYALDRLLTEQYGISNKLGGNDYDDEEC